MAITTTPQLPLPVEDNSQPQGQLELDVGNPNYLLDPVATRDRAFKASYGLAATPAATDQAAVEQGIASGQENQLREQHAATINSDTEKNRNQVITQAIAQKNAPLTDDDMKWINGTKELTQYTDPNSVWEYSYANAYTSSLDSFAQKNTDTNFWNIAKFAFNDDVEAAKYWGSITNAQHNYIISKLQNVNSQVSGQTWSDFLLDFGKIAFPIFNPYNEIKSRGNVPGVPVLEGSLAANLEKQRGVLNNMPWNEFTKTVDGIADGLSSDNPQMAMMVLSSLLGQDKTSYAFNQLNTIGHAMEIGPILKIGQTAYNKIALLNQIRKAVNTVVTANTNPEATAANILASVGDTKAAAIEEASHTIAADIQGSTTPTQRALEMVPRWLRWDKKNIAEDSSTAQTTKNIILDDYDKSESRILNVLATVLRPVRVPLQYATKQVLDLISQDTFKNYKGPSNSIIRLADPLLDPVANEYNVTGWVGKEGGKFFETDWEAANYARHYGLKPSFDENQLANLDAKITDLKQQIKLGPEMDADTAELNRVYALDKQLADLEKIRAEVSTPGGYKIGQHGLGFYIEVNRPLNETSSIIRDFIANPSRPTSVSPRSWTRYIPFLHKARTSEDTLSLEMNEIRKAAVYPVSVMMKLMHEEGKEIIGLGSAVRWDPFSGIRSRVPMLKKFGIEANDEWSAFRDVLDYTQKNATDFHTIEDLNHFYTTNFNRLASEREIRAYFAVKRWSEYDRILREIGMHRFKSRLGAETHQVITQDAAGNEFRSPQFDGVVRQTFPKSGSGNVLIMGDNIDSSEVKNIQRMSRSEKDKWDDQLSKTGQKVIELFDPERRPFAEFHKDGGANIQFVVTKNSETSPLTWEQVNRTEGGHFVYDYENYIKQAIVRSEYIDGVRTHRYEGDMTLHGVPVRAMGEDYVKVLNPIRELMQAGNNDSAKALFERSNLPYTWKEFSSWFHSYKDETGKTVPARFNLTEPFQVVPRNRSIIEMDSALADRYSGFNKFIKKGNFVDNTREGSLARNFQIEFTGQRDATEFRALQNAGTPNNPVYSLVDAAKIDPLQIINRGMGSISRSSLMDDYKIAAVESWIKEAAPHLQPRAGAEQSDIFAAPFYYFKTADGPDSFRKGSGRDVVNDLLTNRFKINQLVGMPSFNDTLLHAASQRLADMAYGAGHPNAALIPPWLYSKAKDPWGLMRSITFNSYLGVFAIPQLFVQMASYANIAALEPRYAAVGTYAALLHQFSRVNHTEAWHSLLDDFATKLNVPGLPNWKPGEFREAMQAADRTGFFNVAGEYAPLNTIGKASPITSSGQNFLYWGQTPFREGERATRMGAWYTAFKLYRDENPTGPITNAELQRILQKADLLYGNMSSASNSFLHTGFLSTFAQFYTYTLRTGEIFFSKRIGETVMDRALTRARLIGFNAALFGLPMGFGVTGLPVADYLRQEFLENANQDSWYNPMKYLRKATGTDQVYQQGANKFVDAIMNGIPQVLLGQITGSEYNVGPRYGQQGFTNILNILKGDNGFLSMGLGASGSFVANTFNNSQGFFKAFYDLVQGKGSENPMTVDDVIDVVKEFQGPDRAKRALVAMATGQWISRNYQNISDVSKLEALGLLISGLDPMDSVIARDVTVNYKAQNDQWEQAIKKANEYWNKALLSVEAGQDEAADTYYQKASHIMEWAQVPVQKMTSALNRFTAGASMTTIQKAYWNRYIKNAPTENIDEYNKVFENKFKDKENTPSNESETQ